MHNMCIHLTLEGKYYKSTSNDMQWIMDILQFKIMHYNLYSNIWLEVQPKLIVLHDLLEIWTFDIWDSFLINNGKLYQPLILIKLDTRHDFCQLLCFNQDGMFACAVSWEPLRGLGTGRTMNLITHRLYNIRKQGVMRLNPVGGTVNSFIIIKHQPTRQEKG